MTTVAIVYFSGTGHNKLMAEAVAVGVEMVDNATAKIFRITGEQITAGRWKDDAMLNEISSADAIVFGSPTYMGGIAAQLKSFVDTASSIWFAQGWKNKLAGGFTHSNSPSGDKQSTLIYLAVLAAQHSMIWIGAGEMANPETGINRLGSYLGVMGNGGGGDKDNPVVEPGDLAFAKLYGQRIAKATHAWAADKMA